jgi:YVTN family beta-propeller protein
MPDLPSGAVTFLFTDIEGSTVLVRRLRDRYPELLAEHQRLLREAFARHGGHEVDTQGDAFFYAFARADQAVLAAIDGQRALLGHPWPEDALVKVRMGVHTGPASPVNGGYSGLAVHRAARLCSAAHGGQVVVSQATQSLLEDEEDALAVRFEDLGDQRLKDIERPVRLYQVAADGLPAEFPPVRGQEEPTDVAEPPPVPLYRRRAVLAAMVLLLVAIAAAAALLLARDSAGGLSGLEPNQLGIIDPESNEIVGAVDLGETPGPVAAGDEGVWVLSPSSTTLSLVDPSTREVQTGGLGGTPGNLAAAGSGAWVTDDCSQGGEESLLRFEASAGASEVWETLPLDDLEVPPGSPSAPGTHGCGLAASAESVWVAANNPPAAARVELDSATGDLQVERVVPLPSGPTAIAIGAGSVWAADSSEGLVRRIDPDTGEVLEVIPVGTAPVAVAAGGDAVWVASRGDDSLTRLDPLTNAVAKVIPVGDAPIAVAVGEHAVWVANSGDGTVSRIDPGTASVTETISVGHHPQGIAVADGAVWVTVRG